MTFFPYKRYVISTNLNNNQISQKLQEVVEEPQFFWNLLSTNGKPFRGRIKGNKFKVMRIIKYMNSFSPIIHGKIVNGSLVIKMRPRLLVSFITLLILGYLSTFIFASFKGMFEVRQFIWFTLVPLSIFVYVYVLMTALFNYEVNKAISIFRELLLSN